MLFEQFAFKKKKTECAGCVFSASDQCCYRTVDLTDQSCVLNAATTAPPRWPTLLYVARRFFSSEYFCRFPLVPLQSGSLCQFSPNTLKIRQCALTTEMLDVNLYRSRNYLFMKISVFIMNNEDKTSTVSVRKN